VVIMSRLVWHGHNLIAFWFCRLGERLMGGSR
jgi:hypothetical protein